MFRSSKYRPPLVVGRACFLFVLLLGFAAVAEPQDAAQLLKQADNIKTSNNDGFTQILKQLNDEATTLPSEQQIYLRYLNAWRNVYDGKFDTAYAQLNAVIDESKDANLRFRAGVTIVNMLAIASRNQEAFTRLNQMLELLPQVSDHVARAQGLEVAALLYNLAGQYNLGLTYANSLLQENATGKFACAGEYLKLEALYKSGKLNTVGKEFQRGIDTCSKLNESLYANLIRADAAHLQIDQGAAADAIKLLQVHLSEVQGTHYAALKSEYDATLAEAYLQTNNIAQAQQFAQRAIDDAVKNQITQAVVDAYRVLYLIAQGQGDYQAALGFHEKYATADKGYLTEESAKALAYQMVHQQVQAKKLQIDSLSKQNQLLQLRQTVDKQSAETRELYIVLLITVLGFIALWAYRTKRSEIKFMKLARRDSLTGIFNHQHFIDAATDLLQYCARSERNACVLVIDLDHFKLVNDTHGHAMGDLILQRMVAACQKHLRSMDIFGRLGGEEFGIALADCSLDMAIQQADDLRLAIACIASAEDGAGFPVHASFGIASSDCSGYILRQLMAHADSALYRAKNEGRNRIVVFNSAVGLSGGLAEEATPDADADADAAAADPA